MNNYVVRDPMLSGIGIHTASDVEEYMAGFRFPDIWRTSVHQPAATQPHQPAMDFTPPTTYIARQETKLARQETSFAEEMLETTCRMLDQKMEELHLTQRHLINPSTITSPGLKQREYALQLEVKALLQTKEIWQSEVHMSQDPSFWTSAQPEDYITAMHQKLHPELVNNSVVNVDAHVSGTPGASSVVSSKRQDDPISSTPVGKQSSRPSGIEVIQPPTPPSWTGRS